jgi:hypothetical protein
VIETAFGYEEQQLAKVSAHLCPTTLAQGAGAAGGLGEVHITHIKPGEVEAVMAQIAGRDVSHRVGALRAGHIFTI